MDTIDLLDAFLRFLDQNRVSYCVIGGQAVNAYVDPLVSLDLDLAVAVQDIDRLHRLLSSSFPVARFPHSLNVSQEGSGVRIQVQTDGRYAAFVTGAVVRDVLGRAMPVAAIGDVLQGKIWAASDPERRSSKRQKDLADISRILEAYPALRERVPPDLLSRLL